MLYYSIIQYVTSWDGPFSFPCSIMPWRCIRVAVHQQFVPFHCWVVVPGIYVLKHVFFFFLKIFCIYLFFREREGNGGRRRGEKDLNVWEIHGCLWLPPHLGTWPHNPGTCPDWESNQQPFGLQARTQSTEPHQPGLQHVLTIHLFKGYLSWFYIWWLKIKLLWPFIYRFFVNISFHFCGINVQECNYWVIS